MTQGSLFTDTLTLSPRQQECYEALRWLIVASDRADVQRALEEHGIRQDRSSISKRLQELEAKGLVERVGRNYLERGVSRTTWRRV